MLLKVVAIALVVLAALVASQVFLLSAFYDVRLERVGNKTGEVGWCLGFVCDKIIYPSVANVTVPSTTIGFDVGPEDLKFGLIPKGSSGQRFIKINNLNQSRFKIRIVPFGNISPYMHFNADNFMMKKGEKTEINVEFRTEPDMELGYYDGGVAIMRIRPKYDFMDFFLEWV